MANTNWFEALLLMDKAKREAIIMDAFSDFGKMLGDIAADIYDSCIKVYYSTYAPVYYGRHGNKAGHNLYRANDFMYNEAANVLRFSTNEENLLPYKGGFSEEEYGDNYEDKRELILHLVMKGQRGSKTRFAKVTGRWPKSWKATYPNKYSRYHRWKSSGATMYTIFDEFMNQVEEGSENMSAWFFEILETKV